MSLQTEVLGKLITAARLWERSHAQLARVRDSKKATAADVKSAERAVVKTSKELRKAVREFDRIIPLPVKQRKAIDWGGLLGAVSVIARGVENAVGAPTVQVVDAEIIDTDGQTVR